MQILAILGLLLAVKRDLSLDLHGARHPLPGDFRAVYCGEYVTVHHDDPYLAKPLRACEIDIRSSAPQPIGDTASARLPLPYEALPATLPPFGLTLFSPLGHLSEAIAQRVFYTISFVCLLASIWAVGRITSLPLSLITIVFTLGMYNQSSILGAIASISTVGLAFTALFYQRKQYILCAIMALFIMLQPQTGLAILAALFVKEARMRIPLIGVGIILLALTIPYHGIEKSFEYTHMLAIHSRAEEYDDYQLSLTYIVRALGTPEGLSVTIGTIAYCFYALIGIFWVRRYQHNDALVVAIPAALSVLPGSFVHILYLSNMFIAGLILTKRYNSMLAIGGIALIATSWQQVMRPSYDLLLFDSILGFLSIGMYLFHTGKQRWIAPIWAALTFAFCAFFVPPAPPGKLVPSLPYQAHFASEEWYHFLALQNNAGAWVWVLKIPYFLGMAGIMIACGIHTKNRFDHVQSPLDVQKGEFSELTVVPALQ